ncbi:flagellin [Halobacteriales archaeon QS_1_68_17]|nr:MAG: flagellin [Halobacteriales archaeon QS_1_68_17]
MIPTLFDTDKDRGQVGIGTLIVFIGMVLVAAIAAGVLINTVGFLQSKSEETGQQSGQQVTNRLEVSSAVGTDIDESDGTLGVVNLTVKKAPGADNIDLENVTAQWVGPSGTYNLVNSSVSSSGADGKFGVRAFKDADNSEPVLNDPDDRMVMVFDLNQTSTNVGATAFGDRLEEGSSVELRLTTKSGATATARLVVPESLSGKSAVTL